MWHFVAVAPVGREAKLLPVTRATYCSLLAVARRNCEWFCKFSLNYYLGDETTLIDIGYSVSECRFHEKIAN